MNIILVIFDSLRKDALSAYGQPPWGRIFTPHFDAFAKESLIFTRVYPESLPTLPARRAIYTGRRVYPFKDADYRLKGDFVGAPGWGPIPEDQPTLAEILTSAGYRTGLISDVYHQFKPSKNFWRGFDQWTFLRGQEKDPARSGPKLTQAELDIWLPHELQNEWNTSFIEQCIMNIHDRKREEDYFAPRVLREASLWLEQNQDAEKFFLTIESFDPHEPWLVPAHYLKMYLPEQGQEQVKSSYAELTNVDRSFLERTRSNYSAEVTMCDRWFGYFMETMRVLGLLENTLVILTSDHGHSIGDYDYMGKRGYPSTPEVYDIPLLIRLPGARYHEKGANEFPSCDHLIQHHDLTASILKFADAEPETSIDGYDFLGNFLAMRSGVRDHVTVGWGSAVTVVTDRWWLNAKVDGTGFLLHDLNLPDPFTENLANDYPELIDHLFQLATADADDQGGFPDWLIELAHSQADAPGCSDLVPRITGK
jgi:arylsulfatase A-like enzyme